ncbi:MAG: ComEA family DNA-binding protein [Gammaproteobacteria bacterium]|nr:ComEA family DNA-binding protein [Gammaproteobacteria bacterium]
MVIGLLSLIFSAAYAAVNINTADQKTLEALTGIGPSKAQAIVQYREKNGPFKTVQDLAKVKGIGDKFVNANLANLTVEPSTTTKSVQ